MDLGSLNYQVIAVEGWGGSGSVQQTVSKGGSSTLGTTTTMASSGGSTGAAGCSALYGQCGGIDWAGPKCCSSGTCQEDNAYYSQCLG
jgi:endo-1,4-beta-xylanase